MHASMTETARLVSMLEENNGHLPARNRLTGTSWLKLLLPSSVLNSQNAPVDYPQGTRGLRELSQAMLGYDFKDVRIFSSVYTCHEEDGTVQHDWFKRLMFKPYLGYVSSVCLIEFVFLCPGWNSLEMRFWIMP